MLKHIRAFVADMDGVLWRDHEILAGAAEFFQDLAAQHVPYVFATNNSSRTVAYYEDKMARLGIPAQAEQIITSAVATADYLAEQYPQRTTLFVMGGEGITHALADKGFELLTGFEASVEVVVVGLDRGFSYEKLHQAIHHVRRGARLIGTNADKTFPIPNGLAPGAGTMIAAVEAGSAQTAEIVGKPALPMFQIALSRLGVAATQTLMIGDRLETDIWGGHAAEMKTALVLSGVAAEQDIINSKIKPDFVFANLLELWQAYRDEEKS